MTGCICFPLTTPCAAAGGSWEPCPCALLELEKQLAISLATAYVEYLVRRKNRRGKVKERGGKGRIKNEKEGFKVGGKEKWWAINNCGVIDSRHHARYLCLHYLSFPAHGTVSVSRIILFMTTQVEGILPSCFHSKGRCKFSVKNYPSSYWMILMSS